MRAALTVAAFLIVAAGCAGPEAPAPMSASTSAPPPAPEPTLAIGYGSITGSVVDTQAAPIEGATVTLRESANSTKTDAAGRFTINQLVPRDYTLIAERIGFVPAAKRITLTEAEVEDVKVVLEQLSFEEPYIVAIPRVAYVKAGESFLDIATHEVAPTQFCDPCHFFLEIDPSPVAGRVEVTWSATTAPPVLNDDLFWLMCANPANGTAKYRCGDASQPGTAVGSGYIKNGASAACCSKTPMANVTKLRFDVHAGTSVAFELRANFWISLAYVDDFPGGYSALPPK